MLVFFCNFKAQNAAMKFSLSFFLFFTVSIIFSQEKNLVTLPAPMIAVDSLYREDQFYFGLTYNSLFNKSPEVSQNKFSSGFVLGFLRDMPVNKSRTIALAAGLGLSYNKCSQNLYLTKADESIQYSVIPTGKDYDKNKLDQLYFDVPIEFRWRTSTPESHKFWRIYSGFKLSYVIWDRYTYVDKESKFRISNNEDLNKLQLGTYLTFGYNTWNFYAYYGITPFFKSTAKVDNNAVGLNTLNLGLMFYVL